MKQPLKIFISAYACEPDLGSEIGVGWHWVLEISKYFELWVLTRRSNQHTIEPWIAQHPGYNNIHFLYFDLPKWARFWKKGLRGVRTYYNIWQVCTNRIVKRTMRQHDIKVFHHLTYGNVLWNVSSYGQKQFFIWGPVGGLESIPKEYSGHYDRKSQIIESVRRAVVRLARWNIGLKKRCENADLILCKTEITRNTLPFEAQKKAILFTDVAADIQTAEAMPMPEKKVAEFITVGHLDAWRGFDLVIEAFAEAAKDKQDVHLNIVGDGPDKNRLKNLIRDLGVESHVTLTGKVTMNEYRHLMQKTDVVVNAALKEGAVTVSFDSMAMGKPLICLDTTGYTRYFTNEYAIVIPRNKRSAVVEELKRGILRLTELEEREKLGQKAREISQKFSWEHRGREFYELVLKVCNSKD